MPKVKSTNLPFWKMLRIAILLVTLLVVVIESWRDQNQNWDKPIQVLLHPINADGRSSTQKYIQSLTDQDFADSKQYLQENIQHYYGKNTPVYFRYGRALTVIPPAVPSSGKVLDNIVWSLKFRYYAWKQHEKNDGYPTATLYLHYYDPEYRSRLMHSTALEKGRIGIVNLFANTKQHGSNQVVLVHELLHTFGATDKYDLRTGQPLYPIGFAEPNKQPRYPQSKAELMGGYIPISPQKQQTPKHLNQTMISRLTAEEVGWLKKAN